MRSTVRTDFIRTFRPVCHHIRRMHNVVFMFAGSWSLLAAEILRLLGHQQLQEGHDAAAEREF